MYIIFNKTSVSQCYRYINEAAGERVSKRTVHQEAVSISHDDEEGKGFEMIASAFACRSHRSHHRWLVCGPTVTPCSTSLPLLSLSSTSFHTRTRERIVGANRFSRTKPPCSSPSSSGADTRFNRSSIARSKSDSARVDTLSKTESRFSILLIKNRSYSRVLIVYFSSFFFVCGERGYMKLFVNFITRMVKKKGKVCSWGRNNYSISSRWIFLLCFVCNNRLLLVVVVSISFYFHSTEILFVIEYGKLVFTSIAIRKFMQFICWIFIEIHFPWIYKFFLQENLYCFLLYYVSIKFYRHQLLEMLSCFFSSFFNWLRNAVAQKHEK